MKSAVFAETALLCLRGVVKLLVYADEDDMGSGGGGGGVLLLFNGGNVNSETDLPCPKRDRFLVVVLGDSLSVGNIQLGGFSFEAKGVPLNGILGDCCVVDLGINEDSC